jgi:PPOX class probable F420-dependent enzyme
VLEIKGRFAAAPVAVLGTLGPAGPRLVPVTFAADGDVVRTAVDGKPKRTARLARLDDIAADPRVSLLVQHWEDDWSRLWWVRADGQARVSDDPGELAATAAALRGKYPQYATVPVTGPVIVVTVFRWRWWNGSADGATAPGAGRDGPDVRS